VAIIRDAAEAGQPIAIVDTANRSPESIAGLFLLTPLMVLLTTPLIRPFRWGRLLWTYLIPLVPFTCWWDGVVSQLRAYRPEELHAMSSAVKAPGYHWETGEKPFQPRPGRLTYLLGWPQSDGRRSQSSVS
jgi:hypothetical protein